MIYINVYAISGFDGREYNFIFWEEFSFLEFYLKNYGLFEDGNHDFFVYSLLISS